MPRRNRDYAETILTSPVGSHRSRPRPSNATRKRVTFSGEELAALKALIRGEKPALADRDLARFEEKLSSGRQL